MALLSSAPSYITRWAPSPAKGNARCDASLEINQEYSRRPLHQRLLKSSNRFRHNVRHRPAQDHARRVGVRLRGNCLVPKRFGNVQPATASPGHGRPFDWVEISSFVENAPPKVEVVHFVSVTYLWHSPCTPRYYKNVDPQIQQPR
jgi:hypothetical protein